MNKPVFFVTFIFFIFCQDVNGQVIGTIRDSIENKKIVKASVSIIRPVDSVLINFTRTDSLGKFIIQTNESGYFLLRITYPEYAPINDTIYVSKSSIITDLGNFNLLTKIHILKEVIVKQSFSAIRFKNDTTEFNADRFKLRPGAIAEDLIKKFPGFTVDRNGRISFQGQNITSVLVDGEEFFGNDPTMATRNINAVDIKKVQLYDKKSLNAKLTGIDDGITKKQLNVVLKDDAKKGYFGKVEAGTVAKKFYQGKATANRFTSLSKKGVYSAFDNTGQNDMNYYEESDYAGTITLYDGNSVRFSTPQDEFSSDVIGLPENISAAMMFNQKYGVNALKNSTVNNYAYKKQGTSGNESNTTTFFLPDSVFISKRQRTFSADKYKHSINTRNEIIIDSMKTLNINLKGSILEGWENSKSLGSYMSQNNILVNESLGNTSSDFRNSNSRIDWYFRNKLKKKGSSASVTFLYETSNIKNRNKSDNQIQYYSSGSLASLEVNNQIRNANFNNQAIQSSLGFIEPVSAKSNLSISYTFSNSTSNQDIHTFLKERSNYDSINPSLSGTYVISTSSNRLATAFNTNWEKSSLRFSMVYQILNLKQINQLNQDRISRNFNNVFPSITYRAPISKSGSLTISYTGNTQQPLANQLQPIPNNIDPLNIYVGNNLLKQAFSNTTTFNIADYNTLKNRHLSFTASYSFINNAFGTNNTINSFGKREIKAINVNGNRSYNFVLIYHKQFKKELLTIDIAPRVRGGTIVNSTNGAYFVTNTNRFSLGIRIDKQFGELIDSYIWYVPEWNTSQTASLSYLTTYAIQFLKAGFEFNLMNGFLIRVDNNTEFRPRLSDVYQNQTVSIFDLSVEKKISQKNDFRVIFSGKDILGQQVGFERNIGTNFVSEDIYTVVQRHFLLTLRWRFSANRAIKKNE